MASLFSMAAAGSDDDDDGGAGAAVADSPPPFPYDRVDGLVEETESTSDDGDDLLEPIGAGERERGGSGGGSTTVTELTPLQKILADAATVPGLVDRVDAGIAKMKKETATVWARSRDEMRIVLREHTTMSTDDQEEILRIGTRIRTVTEAAVARSGDVRPDAMRTMVRAILDDGKRVDAIIRSYAGTEGAATSVPPPPDPRAAVYDLAITGLLGKADFLVGQTPLEEDDGDDGDDSGVSEQALRRVGTSLRNRDITDAPETRRSSKMSKAVRGVTDVTQVKRPKAVTKLLRQIRKMRKHASAYVGAIVENNSYTRAMRDWYAGWWTHFEKKADAGQDAEPSLWWEALRIGTGVILMAGIGYLTYWYLDQTRAAAGDALVAVGDSTKTASELLGANGNIQRGLLAAKGRAQTGVGLSAQYVELTTTSFSQLPGADGAVGTLNEIAGDIGATLRQYVVELQMSVSRLVSEGKDPGLVREAIRLAGRAADVTLPHADRLSAYGGLVDGARAVDQLVPSVAPFNMPRIGGMFSQLFEGIVRASDDTRAAVEAAADVADAARAAAVSLDDTVGPVVRHGSMMMFARTFLAESASDALGPENINRDMILAMESMSGLEVIGALEDSLQNYSAIWGGIGRAASYGSLAAAVANLLSAGVWAASMSSIVLVWPLAAAAIATVGGIIAQYSKGKFQAWAEEGRKPGWHGTIVAGVGHFGRLSEFAFSGLKDAVPIVFGLGALASALSSIATVLLSGGGLILGALTLVSAVGIVTTAGVTTGFAGYFSTLVLQTGWDMSLQAVKFVRRVHTPGDIAWQVTTKGAVLWFVRRYMRAVRFAYVVNALGIGYNVLTTLVVAKFTGGVPVAMTVAALVLVNVALRAARGQSVSEEEAEDAVKGVQVKRRRRRSRGVVS